MKEIKVKVYYQYKDNIISRIVYFGQTIPNLGSLWTVIAKCLFIGVKDINGEELCEDDILAPMANDFEDEYKGNWIVGYRDGTFVAECERGIDDHWIPYWTETEIEKIGNKYENPELSPFGE